MTIRIGFIGCGWVSGAHLEKLKDIPDVTLGAFCDADFERANARVKEYGGAAYSDYQAMIEKEELDAVYVMLPPFAHGGTELACIDAGLPIFVEKPIALDLDTAKKVRHQVEKNKIITAVGYQWRYSPVTLKAVELLKNREIGMVIGHCFAFYPGGSPTWGLKAKSGGQVVEQATHIIDLARMLAGEIERVYCEHDRRLLKDYENFDIADVSSATLRFKNGAVGTLLNSCANVPVDTSLRIIAKDLVLTHRNYKLEIWHNGTIEVFEEKYTGDYYSGGFTEEDRIFIEAVRKKDPSRIKSTYTDACKTLAVTLAIEESASRGKPVKVSI